MGRRASITTQLALSSAHRAPDAAGVHDFELAVPALGALAQVRVGSLEAHTNPFTDVERGYNDVFRWSEGVELDDAVVTDAAWVDGRRQHANEVVGERTDGSLVRFAATPARLAARVTRDGDTAVLTTDAPHGLRELAAAACETRVWVRGGPFARSLLLFDGANTLRAGVSAPSATLVRVEDAPWVDDAGVAWICADAYTREHARALAIACARAMDDEFVVMDTADDALPLRWRTREARGTSRWRRLCASGGRNGSHLGALVGLPALTTNTVGAARCTGGARCAACVFTVRVSPSDYEIGELAQALAEAMNPHAALCFGFVDANGAVHTAEVAVGSDGPARVATRIGTALTARETRAGVRYRGSLLRATGGYVLEVRADNAHPTDAPITFELVFAPARGWWPKEKHVRAAAAQSAAFLGFDANTPCVSRRQVVRAEDTMRVPCVGATFSHAGSVTAVARESETATPAPPWHRYRFSNTATAPARILMIADTPDPIIAMWDVDTIVQCDADANDVTITFLLTPENHACLPADTSVLVSAHGAGGDAQHELYAHVLPGPPADGAHAPCCVTARAHKQATYAFLAANAARTQHSAGTRQEGVAVRIRFLRAPRFDILRSPLALRMGLALRGAQEGGCGYVRAMRPWSTERGHSVYLRITPVVAASRDLLAPGVAAERAAARRSTERVLVRCGERSGVATYAEHTARYVLSRAALHAGSTMGTDLTLPDPLPDVTHLRIQTFGDDGVRPLPWGEVDFSLTVYLTYVVPDEAEGTH